MTQQVDATVKITFEVNAEIDTESLSQEIGHWVEETMSLMDDKANNFAYLSADVLKIREETDIYNEPQDVNPWNFVEKHYPDYYSSQEIAHNNDLSKEIEDAKKSPSLILIEDYNRSCKAIYEKAIENYIKTQGL